MKIAIGADHGGVALKARLAEYLAGKGHEMIDCGTDSTAAVDYPIYARKVAEAVAAGSAKRGVMIDGAGIGSAMTANKVPGVRAAMAYDLSSARNGREHNDANVLTLGAGLIGAELARQIVEVFLTTDCVEPRHLRRVGMIESASGGSSSGGLPVTDSDLGRIVDRVQQLMRGGPAAAAAATSVAPSATPFPTPAELAAYFDHTILKPDACREEVVKLCEEALAYGFKSVCVNPTWVPVTRAILRGSKILTCAVVGFPLGASAPEMKAMEARRAIREGAREIDMVINVGAMKSGDLDLVQRDIRAVTEACRDGSAVSKVIIETALLDEREKRLACEFSVKARANFVKTSTGFAGGGATVEDVALMASLVGDAGLEVKASGGIKSLDDTRRMIAAGATRIGASASVKILKEAGAVAAG